MNTLKAIDIPFGLSVITHYSSGKITAKIKHGFENVTKVRVSYDHSLNASDNHLHAALKCLEKLKTETEKDFQVVYYSYSEKDTGYCFIVSSK